MEVGEEGKIGGKKWKIYVVIVCMATTQKDTDKWKALRKRVVKAGVRMVLWEWEWKAE